jgi:NTP pyrophosphatase (non-canonical NTP hydrolase)
MPKREAVLQLYSRLTEEIAELAEAVRYNHLYPSNFDNELADFVALRRTRRVCGVRGTA